MHTHSHTTVWQQSISGYVDFTPDGTPLYSPCTADDIGSFHLEPFCSHKHQHTDTQTLLAHGHNETRTPHNQSPPSWPLQLLNTVMNGCHSPSLKIRIYTRHSLSPSLSHTRTTISYFLYSNVCYKKFKRRCLLTYIFPEWRVVEFRQKFSITI